MIPHATTIAIHAHYITNFAMVISGFAARAVKDLLVAPGDEGTRAPEPFRYLYLVRRGHRTVADWDRLEQLFAARGFELVDPGALSLADKIRAFREARCVVGPLSSGFTNFVFWRRGTKALLFTAFARCTDTYFGMIRERFGIDLLM